MREYQITVSLNGQFLFRTEWDDNEKRVGANGITIRTCMPLAKVETYSRDKTMRLVDPAALLA